VANRIVSVGDPTRAAALAAHFDSEHDVKRYDSHRPGAFTTFTGRFRGMPVSVIATGMGCPNMDFVVRETRGIVEGPMAIVRFGSCGIIDPDINVGSVCVASDAIMVTRNPDHFHYDDDAKEVHPYRFSRPVKSHKGLSDILVSFLNKNIGEERVCRGTNATADSFYSSQGRVSSHFKDDNKSLIQHLQSHDSGSMATMEMETFHLLDLARCASPPFQIAGGAAVICVASRSTGDVLETSVMRDLESEGGRAVLEAITNFDIDTL